MGLFNKLKDILFDEETVEIPVITKEEVKEEKKEHKPKVREEELKREEPKKVEPTRKDRDEVKITKVAGDEDALDIMPKLREEAKEEVHQSSFTFPIFEDDEVDVNKTRRDKEKPKMEEKKTSSIYDEIRSKNTYSSRKFENLGKKEEKHEDYSKYASYQSPNAPKEEKHFTPSPIISPVYGILNEDYKKEDIVTKSERKTSSYEKLDFEEVRKKAYGTLEDDIEDALDKPVIEKKEEEKPAKIETKDDILDEVPYSNDFTLDDLSDDGLSVSDLLVDKSEEFKGTIDNDEDEEIDDKKKESKEVKPKKTSKDENEALGEDDLFDLIDPHYAGKGEE